MNPTLHDIIVGPGVVNSIQGLLRPILDAPQTAARLAVMTIPDQINGLIATKVTHYALGEVTPRLWREAQPARRHPLVFCIVLDRMSSLALCGTVVAECFHGKFVDAQAGFYFPRFPTDRMPVDNPAFAVGERTVVIPYGLYTPPRLKGRIVTEETFIQTKPHKYGRGRLDRCSESGPRVSLANIIAADSAFDQLFGQFAFSIHQCEWYASVMRHLVAGRAPMSLSDQEVQDLLPPPGHNEVKATLTPSRSGEKLVSDAEPQTRADSSTELKFMSPEQLVAAHARLKEVYDEKLLEVEQTIKQRHQDMLVGINSLGTTHYQEVIRSQNRTIESLERSIETSERTVKVQNEYIAALKQATADSGKQIEMLRALLGQTEVGQGQVARSTPVEPSDIPSA